MRRALRLCSALALAGCSAAAPPAREPQKLALPPPDAPNAYQFGSATADITPPLHLSLFGHGPEGRVATGVRLRLGCAVFFFLWQGEPLVLVPCDLQSSSASLQRGIAERVRAFGVQVPAHRIYVMATHTHAAPGHYFEARRYSGAFSSTAPGYDPAVLAFLVQRIAEAVVTASQQVQPVCLGWDRAQVSDLTFNRSYAPFLSNRLPRRDGQASAVLERASGVQQHSQKQLDPVENVQSPPGPSSAVDDNLFVLRIDRRRRGEVTCKASGPPLAVLSVFGMHPTAVANTNELYHGDVFGFATRFAQACLQQATPAPAGSTELVLPMSETKLACDSRVEVYARRGLEGLDVADASRSDLFAEPPKDQPELPLRPWAPVVGLANGIAGDVSPRVDFQSVASARKLGRELGGRIAAAAAGIKEMHATTGPGRNFRSKYWDVSFPGQPVSEDPKDGKLCPFAELGIASVGGAQDGPTRLRVLPEANAGFRLREPQGCQGYKLPLRVGLSHDLNDFPRRGSLGLLELDGLYLATVPAEPTTMAGLRIRDQIAKRIAAALQPPSTPDDAAKHVAVVGLTNEWLEYVTTEEEYEYQYYEGSSTLYGPATSRFLTQHFDCLAQMLLANGGAAACKQQGLIDKQGDFESSPFPQISRFPPPEDDLKPLQLEQPAVEVTRSGGDVGWGITFPALPADYLDDRHKFRVLILTERGEVLDDDRGSAIEIREVNDGDSWRVRWSPDLQPQGDPLCGKSYRIVVRGRQPLESRSFLLECERFLPGGAAR